MEYTYIRSDESGFTAGYFVPRFIDMVVGIVEILLALRLVLHFLGAGSGNAFMLWLNYVTDYLVSPFAGIFPDISIAGLILELTTIFAMIVYAIAGWIVIRLIRYLFIAARA